MWSDITVFIFSLKIYSNMFSLLESIFRLNVKARDRVCVCVCVCIQVSQEECARLREGVPYVKVYRYNPKHLCPKLNIYVDNGQRNLKL